MDSLLYSDEKQEDEEISFQLKEEANIKEKSNKGEEGKTKIKLVSKNKHQR